MADKAEILEQLRRELLQLQGLKHCGEFSIVPLPDAINKAFPQHSFPTGVIHEFITGKAEELAATVGFVNVVLQHLMRQGGACVWISSKRQTYPPGLAALGIDPERILFIDLQTQKDVAQATEECLKCDKLAAVVSDLRELSFVQSRKLQLATESSRVTGFLLRQQPTRMETTASVARWRISPIATVNEAHVTGLGHPGWQLTLEKIRNGSPGSWPVHYTPDGFTLYEPTTQTKQQTEVAHMKKIG